jgi:phosphoglycolate phosphatase-like HAD superfamily hydrolase
MALIHAFMKALDDRIPDEAISARYSELRGRAYSDILEGMRQLYSLNPETSSNAKDFREQFFRFSESYKVSCENERVSQISGARSLLETVHSLGAPLVVCTGSPRPLAQRFLVEAGLSDLVEARNLYCWGDTEYSKADAAFWTPILGGINRQKIIALDDHPHSAEYLLKVAHVGALVALPSVDREKFQELEAEFPGKITIIEQSWDNWS